MFEFIQEKIKTNLPKKIIYLMDYGAVDIKNLPKIVFTNEASYITQNDRELFHKLRKLRNEIAIENNFPPYIICNNDTLLNIALKNDEDSLIIKRFKANKTYHLF